MMNFQTPTELLTFQANMVKSMFAFIPQPQVRERLASLVDANTNLASAFINASTVYGETMKAKSLAV